MNRRKIPMSRRSNLLALLCLLLSHAYFGSRRETPFGIDAVSAVTPGRVSVVGAVAAADTALTAAQVEEMVRRAVYLSGGMHKAIDPGARWIVVRVADARAEGVDSATTSAADTYLAAVRAVVGLLHQAAGEARISLAAGATPAAVAGPGSGERGESEREGVVGKTALEKLAADLLGTGIEVGLLDLATEESERVEVPDGGEAAAEYAVPIAILECDNIVNVAPHSRRSASGLANLVGLATNDEAADGMAQLVDLALLAEVDYTLLALLGAGAETASRPRLNAILAGHDPIAVDRISLEMTSADTSYLAALRLASRRRLGTVGLQWIKVNGPEVPGTWRDSGPDSTAAQ